MRKIYFVLILLQSLISNGQNIRELYQEGLNAYDQKDYALFREKMSAINEMRPNYPAVVYNLAGSYALTGNNEKSITTLEKYILMDATQDFSKDADFESLLMLPEFKRIQNRQEELTNEIQINVAYEWNVNASHPESITYSKKMDSFFIGGVRDGKIWKIKKGSNPEVFAESTKNSWAVMGLDISPDGKELWVCTSAMTNYEEYDQNEEGYASVLRYDIKSGKLLQTFTLPGGHNFGDLILDKNGNAYISDGTANKLYWVSVKTNKLEVFHDFSDEIFNLQGLTFNEDQSAIYLSDYIDGIYKIILSTKAVNKLGIKADDILIKGIDGLYFQGNKLIGLHNGTKPNRIVSYHLSAEGNDIVGKKTLAQAGILGEPTQGVITNEGFYFICNSPWALYDHDGNFNPSQESIIIGVIR